MLLTCNNDKPYRQIVSRATLLTDEPGAPHELCCKTTTAAEEPTEGAATHTLKGRTVLNCILTWSA